MGSTDAGAFAGGHDVVVLGGGIRAALHVGDVRGEGVAQHGGEFGQGGGEARAAGGEAQAVVGDDDAAVGVGAGAASDDGDDGAIDDGAGDLGRNGFDQQG